MKEPYASSGPRRPRGWTLLACVAFLAAGPGTLLVLLAAPRSREKANALMRDLAALRVGQSGFEEAERVAARHGGRPFDPSSPCTPERCEIVFWIENSLLSRLRLSRRTLFDAAIFVGEGKVRQVTFGLVAGLYDPEKFCGVCIEDFQVDPQDTSDYPPFSVSRRTSIDGRPERLTVRITDHASQEERASAYSLNLGCLSELIGCKDARELAPSLWSAAVKDH